MKQTEASGEDTLENQTRRTTTEDIASKALQATLFAPSEMIIPADLNDGRMPSYDPMSPYGFDSLRVEGKDDCRFFLAAAPLPR